VKRGLLAAAAAAALAAAGPACARPDPTAPLGSYANPIRCAGKSEELSYLGRLRCPDGSAPHWRRAGARGHGSGGTTQSLYRVRCTRLNWETTIQFDRWRPPSADLGAPDGLRLAPAPPVPPCRISGRCGA
jgi:hypothetical protein